MTKTPQKPAPDGQRAIEHQILDLELEAAKRELTHWIESGLAEIKGARARPNR